MTASGRTRILGDPEGPDQQLDLEECLEDAAIEELVSQFAVEQLDQGFSQGASRLDAGGARLGEPAPGSVS